MYMQNSDLFNLINKFNFSGVSFVSLKNYRSDKSDNTEVADILINVGISYEKLKADDLEVLQATKRSIGSFVTENFGIAILEQAIDEKIQSILKPNENRSNGQKDAFVILNNGMKYCPNTDSLIINGSVVRKTVIVKGEFKEVKSKPLTLAKKHLDKALDLKLAKLRYYKLSNLGAIKVSGDTIEITKR